MTCFLFATRTVRTVHRRSKKKKEKKRQPSGRRERRSGREKRKVRQRPVVPWRAIYRTADFFPSFFIPASRAPGGPLRLSFAFYLRRKSPHACSSSSLLPLVLFLLTDRPSNVPSRSESFPFAFFPWLPASRACTRPFFCRISSVPPFVAVLRGAGVARRDATFT